MKSTKYFFLFIALIGIAINASAQIPGGKTKASDYSDAEIKTMIKKAESAGMSEGQVIQLAKARGMSDAEVASFQKRVQSVKGGTSAPSAEETNLLDLNQKDNTREKNATFEKKVKPQPVVVAKSNNKVYGSALFDPKRFPTFQGATSVKPPLMYEIGPGDEIGILVYGNNYLNKVVEVDQRGRIDLGVNFGKIYVNGVRFEKLQKMIKSVLRNRINLSGSELDITLAYSRLVRVNVTGDVTNPGTYTISAVNTIFNALVAAGGPSKTGSLRKIELIRDGKVKSTFDVYDFLNNPSNSYYLRDGDFILVKPQGYTVSLSGAVLRPGRYEIKKSETLQDLVDLAGGFQANATTSNIGIVRYAGNKKSFLTHQGPLDDFLLKNGDAIQVMSQTKEATNKISLSGEVWVPGIFAWVEGMTLNQLFEKGSGFTPYAEKGKVFVIRHEIDGKVDYIKLNAQNNQDFVLQPMDEVVVFQKEYFEDGLFVTVQGAVRNPKKLEYKRGLLLLGLIDFAGGLSYQAEETNVEIIRKKIFSDDYKKGTPNKTIRIPIDMSKEGWGQTPLLPEDIVNIRKITNLSDRLNVNVSGEITFPGSYVLDKDHNRVSDLYQMSGGLTKYAYPEAAELKRGNKVVVFDLKKAIKNPKSKFNYLLQEGDIMSIPKTLDYVILPNTDTLQNNGSLIAPYSGGRAGYYMRNYSLGFDKDHLKRRLYVEHPGGQVKRARHFGLFVLTPKVKAGTKIHFQPSPIKTKKEKEKKEGEPMDWNKFFENLTTKLTAVATLWVLVSRI